MGYAGTAYAVVDVDNLWVYSPAEISKTIP